MEQWKPVNGYTRYEVSSLGKVRDASTHKIKPTCTNGGFVSTNLYDDSGKKVLCRIHRLVAIAFIPNPFDLHNVAHKNDRNDNSVANLYWKPKQEKVLKGRSIATYEHEGKSFTVSDLSKLSGRSKDTIRNRLEAGWAISEIINDYKYFGILTKTHWFPSKESQRNWLWQQTLKQRAVKKEQQQQRTHEWKTKKKCGVGVFVNSPIQGIIHREPTRTYRVWAGIISRCYDSKHRSYVLYGGSGVTVCDEWLEFQKFAAWYEGQYQEDGWHVDKDLLSPDVKLYSPATCCLIPPVLNSLITHKGTCEDKIKQLLGQYPKLDSRVIDYFGDTLY